MRTLIHAACLCTVFGGLVLPGCRKVEGSADRRQTARDTDPLIEAPTARPEADAEPPVDPPAPPPEDVAL